MENENMQNSDAAAVEALASAEATPSFGDMTKDELIEVALKAQKKAQDQEKGRIKYQQQLKELKSMLGNDEAPDQESPKANPKVEAPVQSKTSVDEETIIVTQLANQGFENQDIASLRDAAHRLGVSMSEAAKDQWVMGNIRRNIEARKTSMASMDAALTQTRTSDQDFYSAVQAGQIDLEEPANLQRYNKIVSNLSSR